MSAAPPVREPLPTRPTPAPESPASADALSETPASEAFLPGAPDSQAFLAGRPIREETRDPYGRQAPHPSTAPYTPEYAPEHTPEFAPEGPSSAPECAEDEEQRLTAPLAQSISVPELPAEAPVRAGRRSGPTAPGGERGLGRRLLALRELVGLSRTRLEPESLAEAVRVLDEASARGRLSRAHTTVAVAGPTGCGKSTLFNALAGAQLSEAGVRRPTTATPVACVWETSERTGGADGLLERLGVPPRARRRAHLREGTHRELGGLVLLDLPDHDSLAEGHRQQVDRLLQLVDAVIWVVDPEKYADAVLHERYLRPLAGHAEVTYVVLNQVDRLPEEAAGELLDDLRRLLDEDGMALGEHGDPGAQVLALSALSGQGVCELREALGELVSHQLAAARRLAADVDRVVDELRPVCTGAGNARPEGLTAEVRESFEERLAVAVGAAAAGRTAERVWLRQADLACGTSWAGLARWQVRRAGARRGEKPDGWAMGEQPAKDRAKAGRQGRAAALATVAPAEAGNADGPDGGIARPGGGSADGAARPGTQASEHLRGATDRGPALHEGAGGASGDRELREPGGDRQSTAWEQHTGRPVVEQAVRGLMDDTTRGLPSAWARAVRHAARTGGEGLPGALDRAVAGARLPVRPVRPVRPRWWTAAAVGQALLLAFQLIGVCWLLGGLVAGGMGAERWLPFGLLVAGALGGPALAWGCRVAARGPARAFGLEQESRLRRLAADCGRGRVLEPVAAELLRYTEAREQYVLAAGGPESVGPMR
nr:GTPase [Streptomyces sp. XM4193]